MNDATRHFKHVQAIFDDVVALADDRRAARLVELCGADGELFADVSSLLDAMEDEETATGSLCEATQLQRDAPLRKRIGPYEIESLLGRGGMGAVYLAHRADGEYTKKVAIKLIDLPLATNLFRERFRNERQILAGLDHPLIARMLDGGVSLDGDPYLVMEYVQGVPIHTFCAQQNLVLHERLKLFQGVCEAVQFAHQNLVVHRDLKPDNILVDSDGRPRLLDFGTAKLISATDSDVKSAFTREGFLSFTPQYASPEQVLGKPITTASDTYSLGVLLYLLLSGRPPYQLKEFSTEEMVRVICEQAPRRVVAAPQLRATLGGDLEAIVEKALRKEPENRYRTVQEMQLDVQAFLDSRPVSARQGTIRYKTTKWIKRNRVSFSIAALLTFSLVGGSIAIAWQARIADQQRRIAESRSTDLRELSKSLLSELDDAIKQIPGSTSAQQLLVTRVLEHLDRMSKDAQGDKIAEMDLADAYTTLGKLQGDAYEQNLGDKVGAVKSLNKAVDIALPLAKANPNDASVLITLARAEDARGEVQSQTDDNDGAAASLNASIDTYGKLLKLPGVTPSLIFEAADVYDILGDLVGQDTGFGDAAGALKNYQKVIEMNNRALAMDPGFMRVRRGLVTMQMKLGNIQVDTDPSSALAHFEAALKASDALPKKEQERLDMQRLHALLLRKKADALSELGRYDEAVGNFSQARAQYRTLSAADPKDFRALEDIHRELYDEATSYGYASDPRLVNSAAARHESLLAAERVLAEDETMLKKLLETAPDASRFKTTLNAVRVQRSTIRYHLHQQQSEQPKRADLAALKKDAERTDASPLVLNLVVSTALEVEPSGINDAEYTLSLAKRGDGLTHHKAPGWLLLLAQAYRETGRDIEARRTATEALALLPAKDGGGIAKGEGDSRIRKLLRLELNP